MKKKGVSGVEGPPKRAPRVSSTTLQDGENIYKAFHGEAYKIFTKTAKNRKVIVKQQLLSMMLQLVKEGRFFCSSKKRLASFVDEQFAKHDVNRNETLEFDEFLEFFGRWVDSAAQLLVREVSLREGDLESIFMQYDTNHDFNLQNKEVRAIFKEKAQKGVKGVSEEEIDAAVTRVIDKFDVDKDKQLSFDEFGEAYNFLIDEVETLNKQSRAKVIAQSGFKGMMQRWDTMDQLLDDIKGRFDRPDSLPWLVTRQECQAACTRAAEASPRKWVFFLDEPPGGLDLGGSHFADRGGCTIVSVDELMVDSCSGKIDADAVCAQIRDSVLAAMAAGEPLVVRVGHTTPDFMLSWNKDVLPLDWLDPQLCQPGKLPAELRAMAASSELSVAKDANFKIEDGYEIIFCSCLNESTYKKYLRAKVPMQYFRPVQVLQTKEAIGAVLKDGFPADSTDEQMDFLDSLADLL